MIHIKHNGQGASLPAPQGAIVGQQHAARFSEVPVRFKRKPRLTWEQLQAGRAATRDAALREVVFRKICDLANRMTSWPPK